MEKFGDCLDTWFRQDDKVPAVAGGYCMSGPLVPASMWKFEEGEEVVFDADYDVGALFPGPEGSGLHAVVTERVPRGQSRGVMRAGEFLEAVREEVRAEVPGAGA